MTSLDRRWGRAALVAVSVAGAGFAAGGGARAQLPPTTLPGATTTTAPPQTAPPTTTTTTTVLEYQPTTTAPAPESPPGPSGDSPPAASDPAPTDGAAPTADGAPGDPPAGPASGQPAGPAAPGAPAEGGLTADPGAPPPTVVPGQVPPEAQAAMNAVQRSGSNSTKRLLAALAPLQELGLSEQEAIAAGFGRFPVGGHATFSHDWFFPRFVPTFHLHEGTDIFALTGTPVRSPADGIFKPTQGGSGGLAAYVYEPNGTYYYMAHLSAFVPGQKPGQTVKVGDVVGFVGDSGNAKGGAPHVHFEIHPAPTREVVTGRGKSRTVTRVVTPVPIGSVLPPMDPKATLDQWLKDALAAVPQLIASIESRPRAVASTGITRRLGGGRSVVSAPVTPPRSHLLWASSVSPSGGALRLAVAEAMVAASEFDWSVAARRQQQILEEQAAAVAWTTAVLAPITPPALVRQESADE